MTMQALLAAKLFARASVGPANAGCPSKPLDTSRQDRDSQVIAQEPSFLCVLDDVFH